MLPRDGPRLLAQPFEGFDSVDPRMARIPLNLTDPQIRERYLQNHAEWFLHHPDAKRTFQKTVIDRYGALPPDAKKPSCNLKQ